MKIKLSLILLVALLSAGCADPEGAFEEAGKLGTPQAYQDFIKAFPESEFVGKAREQIAIIQENTAWETANAANSMESWQAFADAYPRSDRTEQALEKIREFEAAAEWERIKDSGSADDYGQFAYDYPASEHAAEAGSRAEELRAIAAAAEAAAEQAAAAAAAKKAAAEAAAAAAAAKPQYDHTGRFVAQLAEFNGEDAAETELVRLQRIHSELLSRYTLRVVESNGWFHVQTTGITSTKAYFLCKALRSKQQECFLANLPRDS